MKESQLDKKLKRYLDKSLNAEYKSLKNKYRDRWVIGTGTLSTMQKIDEEQRHRIAVLERALELAVAELNNLLSSIFSPQGIDERCIYHYDQLFDHYCLRDEGYFIGQAKNLIMAKSTKLKRRKNEKEKN